MQQLEQLADDRMARCEQRGLMHRTAERTETSYIYVEHKQYKIFTNSLPCVLRSLLSYCSQLVGLNF